MTISRAWGTDASLDELGSFHDATADTFCPVCPALSCSVLLSDLFCVVSPSLVYPHEHVSASLVWPFWEPCPLGPILRLGGPSRSAPLKRVHTQQVFLSLVDTTVHTAA